MYLPQSTDVLVVGAGPVGLLLALSLAQQGIDVLVIEKRSLEDQERHGRACTLYPRTMELFEQVDVAKDITQEAFCGRTYAVYNDGKRVTRAAWQSMLPLMDNSFHNYITNIRQNSSQRIMAARLKNDHGNEVNYEWSIVRYAVDAAMSDGYNVTATVAHAQLGSQQIRCKYLVGADGGRSAVRSMAGIDMEGNETTYKWIRIDGRFKTDIPEPDTVFSAIESTHHGSVLWAKLDCDAHRLGFALTPALQAKYPEGPTEEQARLEAVEAVKPFKLEIERQDWWTYYTQQKIAATLQKDEFVLLAGDAAHTHSSAFAQGMNTGVHDATNLAWKLAGALKGWYRPAVLATYAAERRHAAEKLVSIDRLAAQAISGVAPEHLAAAGLTAREAFHSIMDANMSFTVGLGVDYLPSVISRAATATTLVAGARSQDALVQAPGPALPMRLHGVTHRDNRGRWSVLVFAGRPHETRDAFVSLRGRVIAAESFWARHETKLNLVTIVVGAGSSAWALLDGPAVGNLYFDVQSHAHERYGVYEGLGAIVVVRPDGMVGFAAPLAEVEAVEDFFQTIFI
ncbi:hypothetical protein PWT90_02937 [Aphanocladium album]|nr:hypothetical protein PWT90_02937 [Aphanocladium album]